MAVPTTPGSIVVLLCPVYKSYSNHQWILHVRSRREKGAFEQNIDEDVG